MSEADFRNKLKQRVIDVSREILRDQGLAGLQARKVAVASGCSVGTIYNLYGNLDAVIITANTATLVELRDHLARADAPGAPLAQRLEALAQSYLAFAVDRNNEWRAIFEHRFATKTVVPEWYRDGQAELFAIVEKILAPIVESPERRREAARALFAAVHGIVALALDEKLHAFDRAATERQINFLLSAFARGMETRPPSSPVPG